MAVSRRLRYEILRRDNHACRYCGATAPDVKLTVDHVIPSALGGSDEAENLATACASCNSGKSSANPDQPLVADVRQDALRWSAAMEYAVELQRERQRELDTYLARFSRCWEDVFTGDYWIDQERSWHYSADPDRNYKIAVIRLENDETAEKLFDTYEEASSWIKKVTGFPPLPRDWKQSAETWFTAGMSIRDIAPLMETVANKTNVYQDHKWRYFCGCVWQVIKQRQEIAQALLMKQEADS